MRSSASQRLGRARWMGLGLAAVLGSGLAIWSGGGAPSESERAPVRTPVPSASSAQVETASASRPAQAPLRIVRITATPHDVPVGGRVVLGCEVEGGSGEASARRYTWVAARGRLEQENGPTVTWVAPKSPGLHQVGVLVQDGDSQVKQTLMLHVHVPTPEDLRALMKDSDWKQAGEQALAQQAAVEAKLAALREVVARRETREDRLRAYHALGDLAALQLGEGRYEEALQSYEELLGSHLETDPKRKPFLAGKASALFALGREDEALRVYAQAGDHNLPMSHYYAGLLLEARGQLPEAIEAYGKAAEANRWFADPLLRYAELLLRQGRPAREVIDLLVTASPRFGRELLLERLATDPQFASLNQALGASGRASELEERRPIETRLPEPPRPPEPGRTAVITRE
ncbi:tetratricopeptide repeat protein [Archangium lansingense]|uniref:Tetratricopeptide repeat protein n=1 Tax=Archangium lansingense TaxID=2995310 RepID=A0ABT4A9Z8_9BACT|nr:tetratricopeptide repeat protein [Archangium lansinium]MCY1078445.1 tetratricopeptide repeat protein [Archangium lansinium]